MALQPSLFNVELWENRGTLSAVNFPSNEKIGVYPKLEQNSWIWAFPCNGNLKNSLFGRMIWNISKIPSHRARWLNVLDRNHSRPRIQLLTGVGSAINQQGGPVCPSGRLESVRNFIKINVFLQNDLILLNQNFPEKTNPSEHLSNYIVHTLHKNNLLNFCQWLL